MNAGGSIAIQSGICPVTRKRVLALYDGDLPIVPATVYLRHLRENRDLDTNTVLTCAYALKSFFKFLRQNGTSFWRLTPAVVKQYKRFHLSRKDDGGEFKVRRRTALQYLTAVRGLVQYWRGLRDGDPFFSDRAAELDGVRERKRGRGILLHTSWYSRVPNDLWRVRVPTVEHHNKERYKGLSRENCRAVMLVLNRAEHRTEIETMLYYRDRAIWTFMLMSCLRKGELVRVRLEDVNPVVGTISLREREEDAWLGELKTGPGEIYVTPQNPYWRFLDSWLMEGRWIAEARLKACGKEDHGLLFCNRDGGPLTQAAVDHLFGRLKVACRFGPDVFFHPHITRHTTATLMLNNGVQLTEVQRYLRHKSIQSTELYAKVSDATRRQALERFWSHYDIA